MTEAALGDGRVDVVIGIVARAGNVLICQRPDGKSFGGCWEFPGGKREPGETLEECLRRELREELAIEVTPVAHLRPVDHDYPRGKIRLHPIVCGLVVGEPRLLASQDAAWVVPTDLRRYGFPPANGRLIEEVIAHLDPARATPAQPPGDAARGTANPAGGVDFCAGST